MPFQPQVLRRALEAKGWSQLELVARSGVSGGRLSRYMQGDEQPRLANLEAIARALEMPIGLLAGEEVPEDRDVFERRIAECALQKFVERWQVPAPQARRLSRLLGHQGAPRTSDGWAALANAIAVYNGTTRSRQP